LLRHYFGTAFGTASSAHVCPAEGLEGYFETNELLPFGHGEVAVGKNAGKDGPKIWGRRPTAAMYGRLPAEASNMLPGLNATLHNAPTWPCRDRSFRLDTRPSDDLVPAGRRSGLFLLVFLDC
jgi:hypothetical protein